MRLTHFWVNSGSKGILCERENIRGSFRVCSLNQLRGGCQRQRSCEYSTGRWEPHFGSLWICREWVAERKEVGKGWDLYHWQPLRVRWQSGSSFVCNAFLQIFSPSTLLLLDFLEIHAAIQDQRTTIRLCITSAMKLETRLFCPTSPLLFELALHTLLTSFQPSNRALRN